MTPTDSGPDGIGIYDMDPSDMAMSDISEQPNYDPRRHSFSEDELKPQPMIKKARKILVPDNMKVSVNSICFLGGRRPRLGNFVCFILFLMF